MSLGRAVGAMLVAAVVVACAGPNTSDRSTPFEAQPLPGTIHLVSVPAQVPYEVVIRHLRGDDASRVYHQFPAGTAILVVFATLPGELGVQLNGLACVGRYELVTRMETDVVLRLAGDRCSIDTIGRHPEGSIHTDPPTEPKVP